MLTIPILGGLAVGLIMHHFTGHGRVSTVAHVIEGAALHDGRVDTRSGWASPLASLITSVVSLSESTENRGVTPSELRSPRASKQQELDRPKRECTVLLSSV